MFKTQITPTYWLIAHRGASAFAPENTLPSMRLAKQMGAQWVEFDVVLSKDGELFIFHDEKLDRTSNGKGLIAKASAAELKQLDAGRWYATEYQHTPIPTLSIMLAYLAEIKMGMNLEIKPADDRIELLVDGIFSAIEKHWSNELPIPLISSFSIEALRYARVRNPSARLGLLLHEWRDDWQKLADELNCYSVHLNKQIVTKERVNAIHNTDRKVLCYTVNDIVQAKHLFEIGMDGIFSDYPNLLEKWHGI
jgi:glycerophosphoryl diester phosphodiesterase